MHDFVPPPPARLPGAARSESVPQSPPPRRPGSNAPDFDELAFLKSVVDPREAGGSAAARGGPSSAPAPSNASDDFNALVAGSRESAGFGAPAPRPGFPASQRPSPTSQPTQSPSDFPTGERDRMSKSVPAFLKDVPAEQAKTLKCQECGTMNYPTEWYCERCGDELAAM